MHKNVLFLGNFCEVLHIKFIHPKWEHFITIPGNLQYSIDHKKV